MTSAKLDELAQECVTVLRAVVASLVTSELLAKACVLVNMYINSRIFELCVMQAVIKHLAVESIVVYVMLPDNAHVTQASSGWIAQKRAQRQSLEYATVKVDLQAGCTYAFIKCCCRLLWWFW